MEKIIMTIDGMRCGMCETHVNDLVRRSAVVRKVTSSHRKGETVVLCEDEPDVEAIRVGIEKMGYRVLNITREPYEKRGLFGKKIR